MARAVFLPLLWFLVCARGACDPVLVLYPEAPPPYQQAFEQIVAGLARAAPGPLQTLALAPEWEPAHVRRWLDDRRDRASALVLLGQRALHTYAADWTELPVLVGGVNALPGQTAWPGVSLIIDPEVFVQTLRDLLPAVDTVVVIHHAQDRVWLQRVEQAAAGRGLRVAPTAVADPTTAVREITQTFERIDPRTTALWFSRNTLSLNTELIVPFVLEETWNRRIAAFSDTVTHTQRGLLFSLYPDYGGVGEELGGRLRTAGREPATDLRYTRAARLALNVRTARRLELRPRPELLERAGLLFPLP
jgi:putative ABC transport system substrate-binding protein